MEVTGKLRAVYSDNVTRQYNFKGYVQTDESGMSDVDVQTIYDESGNYIEVDEIEGFEILDYEEE